MPDRYKLTRAAELETLPVFRELIAQACQAVQANAETTYDIQLAIDEACTNVITHGYEGLDPGSVMLEIKLEPDQILLTLTDFGHPFEPSEAPQPDINAPLEEREIGGLGLFFIYNVMDNVDYKSDEAGNRLYLTKKLHK
jgi:serine/threonine-protein kinase RsbW